MTAAPLPDAAARAQALDLSCHVLAMAPAGSGKTGLLVQRLLLALATVEAPEQVVAITFTNKAAAEIRNRVLELLARAQRGEAPKDAHDAAGLAAARALLAHQQARGWRLLEQPERLCALTIDSFNARLAKQLPVLSGLGGPLDTAEDPQPLYEQAVVQLFGELEDDTLPAEDRAALSLLLRWAGNRLDRLLQPLSELLARREQWLALVQQPDDAAWDRIEDEALRALVQRCMSAFHQALDPALRPEIADALREASAHSEALACATGLSAWPEPGPECLPLYRALARILVTDKGQLRSPKSVNKTLGFPPKRAHTLTMKHLLERLAGAAELAPRCVELLGLPDAEYPGELRALRRALVRVLRRLAAHLRVLFGQRGEADFAQIAESAQAALRPEGGYGDALLAADARLRHLLVDEMQDTSESQVGLLRQLTAGWQPDDGRSLFLVGDPQQSIYAFRKAEVRLFLELWDERRLGTLPLRCVQLSANFRSHPIVVNWFNDIFERIFPCSAHRELGAVPFTPSRAARVLSEPGGETCGVQILSFPADAELAAARRVALDAQRALPGGSVAVLARTRRQLEPVIRALRALGLTPACQDIDPLAALPAVRDYLALARALWHPADRLSWTVLLRAPFVGLSWADLVALSVGRIHQPWPERLAAAAANAALSAEGRARIARFMAALAHTGAEPSLRAHLAERSETLWHALGGPGCVTRAELDEVRAAQRLLREHAPGGGIRNLAALERALSLLRAPAAPGQVQVMTVHKAKGLEFDHVLLAGCNARPRNEDKTLLILERTEGGPLLVPRPPDSLAEDHPAHRLYDHLHQRRLAARRNETLRLLYVAATRARQSLKLYVCADAGEDGQLRLQPNSFAELLQPVMSTAIFVPPDERAGDLAPEVPRAPRLSLDYRYVAEPDLYRPPERRTLKPSEAVLAAQDEPREASTGDVYAQLVGTLYHEALQRIAQEGLAAWADHGASRRAALAAGLRRRGLPEPRVEPAVQRVLELLAATLGSRTGRWLLEPKPWARSEYRLAGWRDGRWVSAAIDRCFEDADGTLWVVDYKTSAQTPTAPEEWMQAAASQYGPQLKLYAELLREIRPAPRLRAALYFPEGNRLIEPA